MKTTLYTKNIEDLKTEALVVGFYEGLTLDDVSQYNSISEGFSILFYHFLIFIILYLSINYETL